MLYNNKSLTNANSAANVPIQSMFPGQHASVLHSNNQYLLCVNW